ncbi:lysophospholipid acyltransferase family protein [Maricaulis sp. D1M11]|uniref:lysophospholipid acyltransferase family protein n=1 Tax=Maricaulis sp. D1M11 TaxID=3076117 RepID=UPI0039B58D0F
MRSILFNLVYWSGSAFYAIVCFILAWLPGRSPLMHGLRSYARFTLLAMRWICGIKVEVRGEIPRNQPVVIGAKHQSWGDGMVMLAKTGSLSFVCGDHLLNYPLLGHVLRKAGAIVLSNQGGIDAQSRLEAGIERTQSEGREQPVLIYPEGHLTEVGTGMRYRSGVWRLARALDRPVVPVATNLGQCWPQNKWCKSAGMAVIEFLPARQAGEAKADFLSQLEHDVEARSRCLEAEFASVNQSRQCGLHIGRTQTLRS